MRPREQLQSLDELAKTCAKLEARIANMQGEYDMHHDMTLELEHELEALKDEHQACLNKMRELQQTEEN